MKVRIIQVTANFADSVEGEGVMMLFYLYKSTKTGRSHAFNPSRESYCGKVRLRRTGRPNSKKFISLSSLRHKPTACRGCLKAIPSYTTAPL